jgi:hypothetical protein
LQEKKDEILLRELLRRWSNHKTMTIWLAKCFHYLDRYHIPRKGLPSLEEIGFLSFYHLVGDDIHIPMKCYTTVFYFAFLFSPFFNSSSTSFCYQVYDEMHRQVMDAILSMVFSVFQFCYVFYNQFIYQFIITIDGNFWIHKPRDTFVYQLSYTYTCIGEK